MTKGIESEREDIGTVYSNFDHDLETEIAERLATENVCAGHTAWDFYGKIYHKDGKWFEEVWQHHAIIETLEADSILKLIDNTNERYGSE